MATETVVLSLPSRLPLCPISVSEKAMRALMNLINSACRRQGPLFSKNTMRYMLPSASSMVNFRWSRTDCVARVVLPASSSSSL